MANLRSTEQSPITGPSAGLLGRRRVQAFAFGGLLLVLMKFSAPDAGMIDLPVTFFLKNRMHVQVSAETHRLLAADYEFIRRELPQVKGKGDLTAWLLAGRRR